MVVIGASGSDESCPVLSRIEFLFCKIAIVPQEKGLHNCGVT